MHLDLVQEARRWLWEPVQAACAEPAVMWQGAATHDVGRPGLALDSSPVVVAAVLRWALCCTEI